MKLTILRNGLVSLVVLAASISSASAALIYDGSVTPSVIFGTGNGNGFFVVDRQNNVELGLRAKVPYESTYNSDGEGVYSMNAGLHPRWGAPGTAWNFEFSINSDLDGSTGRELDALVYELMVDLDPSEAQAWFTFSPLLYPDNAINIENTLAQNSQNIGWLGQPFDTNSAGIYDFRLRALLDNGQQNQTLLAQTSMRVQVSAVSAPAAFGLLSLSLLGLMLRRKK